MNITIFIENFKNDVVTNKKLPRYKMEKIISTVKEIESARDSAYLYVHLVLISKKTLQRGIKKFVRKLILYLFVRFVYEARSISGQRTFLRKINLL